MTIVFVFLQSVPKKVAKFLVVCQVVNNGRKSKIKRSNTTFRAETVLLPPRNPCAKRRIKLLVLVLLFIQREHPKNVENEPIRL